MATNVVPDSIRDLVERFDRNRAVYGPFFTALGRYLDNRQDCELWQDRIAAMR
jgi:hypothetical protein